MNAKAEYKEPYVTIEVITPRRAKEMLDTMGDNRTLSLHAVNRLAKDMTNGFFTLNNDAVCVDEDGRLMNGQHRLNACIKANKPITVMVLYNLPRNTIIDTPRKRSISDLLTYSGEFEKDKTKSCCMSAIRAYFSCKANGPVANELSPHDFKVFVSEFGESMVLAVDICSKGDGHPIMKKAGCFAAVFAAIECGVDEDSLYRFSKAVNSGFPQSQDENAAIVLRKYLLDLHKVGGGSEIKNIAAYTERAISEFIKGNPAKHWRNVNLEKHFYIDSCNVTI